MLTIRHGRTAWNVERRFLGRSDIPLDEEGRSQGACLAQRLAEWPIDVVYTSPLSRARETASGLGRPLVVDPRLSEMDQGDLEGLPGRTLPERYPDLFRQWMDDPSDVRVPGGETLREVQTRAESFVHDLAAHAVPGRLTVVVTHKMWISALACSVLGLPLRHARVVEQGNTALNVFVLDAPWALVHANDTNHIGSTAPLPPRPPGY